ncbi:MAG: hypothetical protein P1U89_24590, partial [Verrucomicrobiales bacterium]|nr:hypothetical protein [Verrucomicrobiales bacterium]
LLPNPGAKCLTEYGCGKQDEEMRLPLWEWLGGPLFFGFLGRVRRLFQITGCYRRATGPV